MAAVGDLRTLFCNSDVNQLQEAENAIRLNEEDLYLSLLSSSCSVDLEKKKEELRQLVGKRYRDIIDAADNIKAKAMEHKALPHIGNHLRFMQNQTSDSCVILIR